MSFMRWTHKPRRGDKFYDGSRPAPERNGFILDVLWNEDPKEVRVKFYTATPKVYKSDTFTFDEIQGRWTDRMGGVWLLDEGEDAAISLNGASTI